MIRTGTLQVTKECSAYTGAAGDFCTITSSNIEEVAPGTRVVYEKAAGAGTLDTDVILDGGEGNTAAGHVVLDLASGTGVATFSGGTGKFTGFEARADVSADAAGLWHWEGTYSLDSIAEPETSLRT
jgi:hypothetical protein